MSLSGDRKKFRVPPPVVFALRCNAGLRMLSGFLTMYMAFLLRQHPLPGWEDRTTLLMGLVIGAAGLGNTVGIGRRVGAAQGDPVAHGGDRAGRRRRGGRSSRRCSTG